MKIAPERLAGQCEVQRSRDIEGAHTGLLLDIPVVIIMCLYIVLAKLRCLARAALQIVVAGAALAWNFQVPLDITRLLLPTATATAATAFNPPPPLGFSDAAFQPNSVF